ncbi:MAG: FHA domain-containing protein [Roseiflexus sp.]|nr:FHA domain-containing protein [Roseiflexus sp.]MCS7289690.1 FHA domain-containing protein [Roseiflexus sp.]MDW8232380.1 FHA domain-containing protein [Roseiflexaceae bacterium]
MQPQIYIGRTPDTAHERVALRERALTLAHAMQQSPTEGLCAIVFNIAAGADPPLAQIDLLVLRATAVIVGALRTYAGPIDALPGRVWRDRATGQPILEEDGAHPLHRLRQQRNAVQMSLNAAALRLGVATTDPHPFKRVIGLLIGVPTLPADSRISLDVDDHRDRLKVCSFDELPGVASMSHSGVTLSDEAISTIAAHLFGGRLWYDDNRFLFELAPPRFQLSVRAPGKAPLSVPLYEGETIVGRRKSPQGCERRVSISDDELVSSDHLRILCGDRLDSVIIRDMSKNGTWVTLPDGQVEYIRNRERVIPAGARLRLGMTDMILERV